MATTKKLKIDIELDATGAIKGVKGLGKESDKLSKFFKKQSETNKKSWSSMVTGINQGLEILRKGFRFVVKSVGTVVKAYAEQERAQNTLAAAMRQAGTFTQEAFEHNLKYAASLQKMTTFGDEAIIGVQKMLTNFGVEGIMLDKLTKATLDLAAAKGMDLKSAADLVAKSVGSSTNALTRYGIEVTGAVGSTERMNQAVTNITRLFGGAARAEAETFSGSVKQMRNIIGDLQERIGKKLIPVIMPFVKLIGKWASDSSELDDITKDLIDTSTEYNTIIKKLKGNTDELTTSEEALLKVRALELQEQLVEIIKELNKTYSENAAKTRELKNATSFYGEGLESVSKKLNTIIDSNGKLTKETLSLNQAEQQSIMLFASASDGMLKSTKILQFFNIAKKKHTKTSKAFAIVTQDEENRITAVADALNKEQITLLQLAELHPARIKQIQERALELRKEEETAAKTIDDTTEKTIVSLEDRKEAWNQYYTFIGDQRTLDIEKENEDFEMSKSALKLLRESNEIGKVEHDVKMEEIEMAHRDRLAEIDIGFKTTQAERDALADQFFEKRFDELTKKQKESIEERVEAEKKGSDDFKKIWQSAVGSAVNEFGTGITDMIFSNDRYKKSFGEVVVSVLAGIGKMIFKLLLMKGIMAAFGGIGLFFKEGGQIPEFGGGGKLSGPSHAQGGMNVNVEGGEYMVSKDKVTADTLPILMAINNGISGLAGLSMGPIPKFAEGGPVTTNNSSTTNRTANLNNVKIVSPDPRKIFNQIVEYADNMGVNLVGRG